MTRCWNSLGLTLGISCVTREFAGQYLGSGALFEIQTVEKLPPRHVGVCTLKGVSVSPAGKAFLALIQQDEETLEREALDENAGLKKAVSPEKRKRRHDVWKS